MQVRFERIQPGSLPPKFTRIKTEVGPRDTLVSSFFYLLISDIIIKVPSGLPEKVVYNGVEVEWK